MDFESVLKIVAESPDAVQVANKYINYLYFETALVSLALFSILGIFVYCGYKVYKADTK